MAFVINAGNEDLVDYSVPIPAGAYVMKVDECSYVEKKSSPGDYQLDVVFSIMYEVTDDGSIEDSKHVGRKVAHMYVDPSNPKMAPYMRQLFTALGYPYEDDETTGNREFQFEDHIDSYDALSQDMLSRMVLGKIYIGTNKRLDGTVQSVNKYGKMEPVPETMEELFF